MKGNDSTELPGGAVASSCPAYRFRTRTGVSPLTGSSQAPMTPRPIAPTPREGSWELQGGYRQRAELALRRISEAVVALAAEEPSSSTVNARAAASTMSRLQELQLQADAAVLVSAMAVESFLNFYGVVRLGQDFHQRYLERTGAVPKLALLVAINRQQLLGADDEIVKVADEIFSARNALAHPKTRETPASQGRHSLTLPEEQATFAVERMRRFFELFEALDPGAPGTGVA